MTKQAAESHKRSGGLFYVWTEQLLLFSVPAICTNFIPVDADGLEKTFERLIAEGVKAHFLANRMEQTFASFSGGVRIFIQMGLSLVALLEKFKYLQLYIIGGQAERIWTSEAWEL